jgi:hypothetical protein
MAHEKSLVTGKDKKVAQKNLKEKRAAKKAKQQEKKLKG